MLVAHLQQGMQMQANNTVTETKEEQIRHLAIALKDDFIAESCDGLSQRSAGKQEEKGKGKDGSGGTFSVSSKHQSEMKFLSFFRNR